MTTKLIPHEGGWALVLDRALVDSLRFDETTTLDVSVRGGRLIVGPGDDAASDEKFDEAVAWSASRYGDMYRRLAS